MTIKEANEDYIVKEEIEFLGKPVGERFVPPEMQVSDYSNMKVELTSPTTSQAYKDWVNSALYNSMCTWDTTPHLPVSKMVEEASFEEKEKRLLYILSKRPISVALEGVMFSFKVINMPRALTHQWVRSRQWAFGQQSFRVSSCYSDPVRVPQSLVEKYKAGDERARVLFHAFKEAVIINRQVYKELIEYGIPMEQSRQIMPMGTCTKIGAVMRLRDLIDYVKGRTGTIAQDEHTLVVVLMLRELQTKQPEFFNIIKTAVPSCIETMRIYGEKYLDNKNVDESSKN